MSRVLTGSLFSALAVFGFATAASALSGPVLQSGNTFYRAACALSVGHAAYCHAKVVTDASGHALTGEYPAVSGYSPANLRDAYNIYGTGSSSRIIAIVDAYGYTNAEKDLGAYRSQFGLPVCTTANGCFRKFNQSGQQTNYPPQNLGWMQESALDLDMVSAMCPTAKSICSRRPPTPFLT
jgi:subtilase family serine protease